MFIAVQRPAQGDGRRGLLSIVVPAFNEQDVLAAFLERLTALDPLLSRRGLRREILFINDGSTDQTLALLNDFAGRDAGIRAVHLTRNFGQQAAISAGLALARGDVIAVMDCDLQDPPEVLPRLLDEWERGFQVVFAVRQKRKEGFGRRLAYWSFYRLLARVSELRIPLDSGDFCVMDRRAVDLLNSLPENQRFVRGLRTWVGLRQRGVVYERDVRHAGKPAYTFAALLRLALDGLVSFSSLPLKWVTRLGILCGLAAIGLGIALVITRLCFHAVAFPWGWLSLACLVLLLSSVQLLSLGIMGEYVARIFTQVKGRPTYLIADVVEQSPAVESPSASIAGSPEK